jgi:ABC-type transport system involved in multi-copper enzyme maturation permease subunit
MNLTNLSKLFLAFVVIVICYIIVYIFSLLIGQQLLYTSKEGFDVENVNDFDPTVQEQSTFVNFSLNPRPVANAVPFPVYAWQENRSKHLWKPFKDGKFKPMPDLQSTLNNDESFVNWKGYDSRYYCNAENFCKQFPEYELCPNGWQSQLPDAI